MDLHAFVHKRLSWTECVNVNELNESQCDDTRMWGLWEVIGFRWGLEDGAPMVELVFLWEDRPWPFLGVACGAWSGQRGRALWVSLLRTLILSNTDPYPSDLTYLNYFCEGPISKYTLKVRLQQMNFQRADSVHNKICLLNKYRAIQIFFFLVSILVVWVF